MAFSEAYVREKFLLRKISRPHIQKHRRCDHVIKLVELLMPSCMTFLQVRAQLMQSGSTIDNYSVHVALQWFSGRVEGCIKQSSPGVSSECVIGYFNPWLGQWSIDYLYTCRWSASTLDSRNRIQEDLAQLEQWSEIKRMQFNKDKHEVLCSGSNNQLHKYKTWNE